MRGSCRKRRPAWNLVELVVVIAITAVLIGLILPAIFGAHAAAQRLSCANRLKQLGLAMQLHHDTHQVFPSNGGWDGQQTINATNGKPIYVTVTEVTFHYTFTWGVGVPGLRPQAQTGSWAFALLPFLQQEAVYQQRAWTDPLNAFLCPGRGRPGALPTANDQYGTYNSGGWTWSRTDYAANALTVPNRPRCLRLSDIPDGASQTVLIGEKSVSPLNYASGTWYWDEPLFLGGSGGTQRGFGSKPGEGATLVRDAANMDFNYRYNWGSAHPTGTQFLFADGSVRLLPYATPSEMVHALLTPNGGEIVPSDL